MNEAPNTEKLNHIEFLATLDHDVCQDLNRKDNLSGLVRFFSQILVLSLTSFWILKALPGWQIALILQGILLVFFFTLLHETSHFTPFASTRLNTAIGWFCGIIIFLPPNHFRYFHLAHHRHTNDPENDPELEGDKPETIAQYIWAISGVSVWQFHSKTLFINAIGRFKYPYLPQKRERLIIHEARLMLCLYAGLLVASLIAQTTLLFWIWILPMALGQPFLRLYLMAEHGRCPHVANMLENTRTTFTNWFVRWIAWNMPYHAEHHALPTVPFHKLPKLHGFLRDHLQTTSNSFREFHSETLKHLNRETH